jgi:aryl-alcohol dehydrogenase-like predicted oxidoreductase
VGEALAPFRKQVVIASKFGFKIENGGIMGLDSRPVHNKEVAEASSSGLKLMLAALMEVRKGRWQITRRPEYMLGTEAYSVTARLKL